MGDLDYAENDWETSKKCSAFRSTMDSYSYRLTHDLSLDSFQSEDIFNYENTGRSSPTGSVFSNDSFTLCNKPRRIGSTSSSKDGSQADKLREDMIELDLSEGGRSYPLGGDWEDPGDEARKLLSILDEGRKGRRKEEKEKEEHKDREKGRGSPSKTKESSRRRRASSKENDHTSGQRSGERRRKSRRKGRKLPQMPTQGPANLQAELLAAEQRPLASPTDDSQSPTDNCQPQSSPSPITSPETPVKVPPSSSQPTRPSQLGLPTDALHHTSAPMPDPVLPHEEVPRPIVDSISPHFTPFLSNTNLLLQEDSSPESLRKKKTFSIRRAPPLRRPPPPKQEDPSDDEKPSFQPVTLVIDGEIKVQSHKALYRFFPRHDDELLLDTDDPVYVEVKGDDLWYEGINLRTGDEGCFPSRYVRDYTMEVDGEPGAPIRRVHISRFRLQFLGSVETPFHRGNEVLCRAMQKVVMARRMTPELRPPTKCILEISDNGVRMIDQSKSPKPEEKKDSVRKKVEKFLSGKQKGHNYYFSLKNISYCGFHPQSSKYFGFITKHPNDRRFACHVFITENAQSGQPLAEAMGAAFKRFYAEFLDYTNPTEDIYLE